MNEPVQSKMHINKLCQGYINKKCWLLEETSLLHFSEFSVGGRFRRHGRTTISGRSISAISWWSGNVPLSQLFRIFATTAITIWRGWGSAGRRPSVWVRWWVSICWTITIIIPRRLNSSFSEISKLVQNCGYFFSTFVEMFLPKIYKAWNFSENVYHIFNQSEII